MNTTLNIQRIPIEKMKPAKYNPRKKLKPSDPEYVRIKNSLDEHGLVEPLVWNEVTGNIVGGHQRYNILVSEGATEIDCSVVHIEDPNKEKELNIKLNKATGLWDDELLAGIFKDFQEQGIDVQEATGFFPEEVDDIFSNIYDKDVHEDHPTVDPETVEPFVERGDIWTLGKHRMMCGDATDGGDVALLMNGYKANLVVTDPPYNVDYESADGKKIENDKMADEQFYQFLLSAFRNMAEFLAPGSAAYVFHADLQGVNFRKAFQDAGFHLSCVCIWMKDSLVLGRADYQWQHEPVLYGFLPGGKHRWFSDRKQTSIWQYAKPKKSEAHPTMKPIQLVAYPIKNSSAPNGIVMDLFGGSGSTLIACDETDRICRTMELDPKYASSIVLRYIEAHGGNHSDVTVLRNGTEHTFEELCGDRL